MCWNCSPVIAGGVFALATVSLSGQVARSSVVESGSGHMTLTTHPTSIHILVPSTSVLAEKHRQNSNKWMFSNNNT